MTRGPRVAGAYFLDFPISVLVADHGRCCTWQEAWRLSDLVQRPRDART